VIKNCLILDLETIPNEISSLWESENKRDFQPTIFHEMLCAGWMRLSNEFKVEAAGILGLNEMSEKEALSDLVKMIDKDTLVVTWSGRRFDLPVVSYRCMKYGVTTTWDKDGDFRNRFRTSGHFDLQDHMMHHGAAERLKLDHAAALIGLPGKMETSGSDVSSMAAKNRWGDIGSYCMTDVVQTMVLFIRYSYLIGLASRDEVNESLNSLEEYLSRLASSNSSGDYIHNRRISSLSTEGGIRKIFDNCDWPSLFLE